MLMGALLGAGLLGGCAGTQRSVVDMDTYQMVTLGPLRYTVPDGYSTEIPNRSFGGKQLIRHSIAELPDCHVSVSLDFTPPRRFRLDADAAKRTFMRELGNGRLLSAQYSTQPLDTTGESATQEWMKLFVDGTDDDKNDIHGAMLLVREGNTTAIVRVVGPHAQRHEINRVAEHLGASIKFNG